jgi:hypothetical protein
MPELFTLAIPTFELNQVASALVVMFSVDPSLNLAVAR